MSVSSGITEGGTGFLGSISDFISDAVNNSDKLFAAILGGAAAYHALFPDDPSRPRAPAPAPTPTPTKIPWLTLVLVGGGLLGALLLVMAIKG